MAKGGNVTNPGVGGASWARDRDGANLDHQYVKIAHGPEGTFNESAEATPFPVQAVKGRAATSIKAGFVDLTGSVVQLPNVPCRCVKKLTFVSTPEGEAQIGESGFTTSYYSMPPGKELEDLEIANLNVLFAKADVAHAATTPRRLNYLVEV